MYLFPQIYIHIEISPITKSVRNYCSFAVNKNFRLYITQQKSEHHESITVTDQ